MLRSNFLTFVVVLWTALSMFGATYAHEVRPAVADADVSQSEILIQIRVTLEPLLAGMDLAGLEDTNDSPLSDLYDQIRALPAATLETQFRDAWPTLRDGFVITSDGQTLLPEIVTLTVPPTGDVELPRDSSLTLRADLPPGDAAVQFGWSAAYGPIVVRQAGEGDDLYAAYLSDGTLSEPMPRQGVVQESAFQTFSRFVILGVEHIVPKGLDHILFVLGLFFFSLKMRPLLLQVTAFTAAHTVTLALASLGYITVPASVVEPLIAASIVFVAVENIRGGPMNWTRFAVVFGFGLLHGLGFASVLSELNLPAGRFVTGLIAFNIGVELGQLSVILAAFCLLALPFGDKPWYRRAIAIPGSALIAAIGAWWVVERVFL